MPALVGRKVTFTPTSSGGTPITGMRSKNITINNEAIDTTNDDDSGWQSLLADDPAVRSVELDVSGVLKDAQLIELGMTGGDSLISGYALEIQGIGTFTGDFYIGTVTIGAEYQDAVSFSTQVRSSGPVEWTAAS